MIFLVSVVVMVVVSHMTPAPATSQLTGLTYATMTAEQRRESRRSWDQTDLIGSVFVLLLIAIAYIYSAGSDRLPPPRPSDSCAGLNVPSHKRTDIPVGRREAVRLTQASSDSVLAHALTTPARLASDLGVGEEVAAAIRRRVSWLTSITGRRNWRRRFARARHAVPSKPSATTL